LIICFWRAGPLRGLCRAETRLAYSHSPRNIHPDALDCGRLGEQKVFYLKPKPTCVSPFCEFAHPYLASVKPHLTVTNIRRKITTPSRRPSSLLKLRLTSSRVANRSERVIGPLTVIDQNQRRLSADRCGRSSTRQGRRSNQAGPCRSRSLGRLGASSAPYGQDRLSCRFKRKTG
jgi:hypothetical protein